MAVFLKMVGSVKIKPNFPLCWINLLLLCLIYPTTIVTSKTEGFDTIAELSLKKRNILVNILINKLFASIRHIITHGSPLLAIPILDPFEMDDYHLVIPAGIFNFDFQFKNISVIGFGGFILHRNILHLSNLTFEMEVSLPRVVIAAEALHISEIDNNFTPISPLTIMYNKEKTELEMDNFRLQVSLQLKQSDDKKSILIDKIDKAFWDIPSFRMNSNGVVDSDNFEISSDLEEGFVDYVKSCKDIIVKIISNAILIFGNPILNSLDTWRYINILL